MYSLKRKLIPDSYNIMHFINFINGKLTRFKSDIGMTREFVPSSENVWSSFHHSFLVNRAVKHTSDPSLCSATSFEFAVETDWKDRPTCVAAVKHLLLLFTLTISTSRKTKIKFIFEEPKLTISRMDLLLITTFLIVLYIPYVYRC